ncbi:imidazoleglycerol-phosphate dehydratase HisB [Methylobacterium segetis]|uniref:imidazoleglycerol-phosphate dehydratase HisB n=1 Tax=Methylobacterium segetis TaxID=2488750 RepID=UPI001052FECF|nr:imidazoleglycerol-phosphate dehydratase HisB [Methylobacterium segetis]
MRAASLSRRTAETDVTVSIDLDGTGKADIATGVGFLDHMLDLFARHALFDVTVKVEGDLHVDQHHTPEDAGIALGQAFAKALGDKRGIARYADIHLPMDETLSRVALDISGRPFLVFRTQFRVEKIGQFDTELVREWFQAFAMNAGITLHVETLYGDNAHHIAESCFKGLARALRGAVAVDAREEGRVPSTKGSL